MNRPFTVTAIIAAYNEGDIVGQVVRNLIDEGIQVYFIDHGSTDDTVAAVRPYRGKGVIDIETAPEIGGNDDNGFAWQAILRRKEEIARELDSDWFIHHDADEFRESPWRHLTLRDAIHQVDAFGYNAIDFEVLNFWPTHDDFQPRQDVRESFRFFAFGGAFDKTQIKCWKKLDVPVDLATGGGHEARFEGRRVFPIRFLLRHYPLRGQAHAERKVFRERISRFSKEERSAGWHVQYNDLVGQPTFIRDPRTMTAYDPDAVRLHVMLQHRGLEELETRLRDEIDECRRRFEESRRHRDLVIGQLHDIQASTIWRWSAPLRALITRIRQRRSRRQTAAGG